MPPKLRVVKWIVQPVAVRDDGEHLTEIDLKPFGVPASRWEEWAGGGWRDTLEMLRAEVEGPAAPLPAAE